MKKLFFSIVLLLITTTGLFASGTNAKGGQQLPAELKAISAYALQVVGNPASTGTDAPIGTLAIDAGTDNPSLYMKVGLSSNDWVKVPFLQLSNSFDANDALAMAATTGNTGTTAPTGGGGSTATTGTTGTTATTGTTGTTATTGTTGTTATTGTTGTTATTGTTGTTATTGTTGTTATTGTTGTTATTGTTGTTATTGTTGTTATTGTTGTTATTGTTGTTATTGTTGTTATTGTTGTTATTGTTGTTATTGTTGTTATTGTTGTTATTGTTGTTATTGTTGTTATTGTTGTTATTGTSGGGTGTTATTGTTGTTATTGTTGTTATTGTSGGGTGTSGGGTGTTGTTATTGTTGTTATTGTTGTTATTGTTGTTATTGTSGGGTGTTATTGTTGTTATTGTTGTTGTTATTGTTGTTATTGTTGTTATTGTTGTTATTGTTGTTATTGTTGTTATTGTTGTTATTGTTGTTATTGTTGTTGNTGTSGGGTGTTGGTGTSGNTGTSGGGTGTCISPSPTVLPASVCQGGAIDLNQYVQGNGLLWYDSPFDPTGSVTAPVVNTSVAGTQSFYVSQTSGDCAESNLVELQVTVVAPMWSPGVVIASQGNQGGITPFYYNQDQIVITGGLPPYNFDWDNTGYVRYDIEYTADGATITIYYADAATWAVTVTDENSPCSDAILMFSNDYLGNTIIDIKDFSVSNDSDNSNDGAVDITVEGGDTSCGGYTYAWDGPDGFTATTEDISGLTYGWYHVVATDCAGEQTEGWYWVALDRRGRKTDMASSINAYPNPTAATTNITFTVGETGNTTVTAFDLTGKQIANLFNAKANAGETYNVSLDAANLPAGMYILKLTTQSGMVETYKLTVAR